MCCRRIGQLGLARGWSAWAAQWEERTRQQRLLAAAGARLLRPKLAASIAHWRSDWEAAERAAAAMTVEERMRSEFATEREALAVSLRQAQSELEAERLAAEQGRGQDEEWKREMAAKLEAEREKRIEHIQQIAIRCALRVV